MFSTHILLPMRCLDLEPADLLHIPHRLLQAFILGLSVLCPHIQYHHFPQVVHVAKQCFSRADLLAPGKCLDELSIAVLFLARHDKILANSPQNYPAGQVPDRPLALGSHAPQGPHGAAKGQCAALAVDSQAAAPGQHAQDGPPVAAEPARRPLDGDDVVHAGAGGADQADAGAWVVVDLVEGDDGAALHVLGLLLGVLGHGLEDVRDVAVEVVAHVGVQQRHLPARRLPDVRVQLRAQVRPRHGEVPHAVEELPPRVGRVERVDVGARRRLVRVVAATAGLPRAIGLAGLGWLDVVVLRVFLQPILVVVVPLAILLGQARREVPVLHLHVGRVILDHGLVLVLVIVVGVQKGKLG